MHAGLSDIPLNWKSLCSVTSAYLQTETETTSAKKLMMCHPWVCNCHGKLTANGKEVLEFSVAGKAKRCEHYECYLRLREGSAPGRKARSGKLLVLLKSFHFYS